jgi:hypothetical protein
MPIVGGLDIHRKQLTFDYLDTETGEVKRGQVALADRAHLRAWLARFAGRDDVAFALEGAPAGGTSRRSWPWPASRRTSPSRLTPRWPGAASGTPRPARPARGICGSCWPRAGCPSAGSRPGTSWSAGGCWSCITTCGAGHTAWLFSGAHNRQLGCLAGSGWSAWCWRVAAVPQVWWTPGYRRRVVALIWVMSSRLAARAAARSSSRSASWSFRSVACCARWVIFWLRALVPAGAPSPESRQACWPRAWDRSG